MKKNKVIFLVFVIILFAIILILININTNKNKTTQTINLENRNFSLTIQKENNEIYKNENIDKIWEYNTLLVPMDIILSNIFENYNEEAENQTLTCNNTTLEVKKIEDIISVPNVYELNGSKIDDTVDVEIENINGIMYIPLYLISNIDGIEVEIDNKEIYNKNNYYNANEVIDTNKEKSNITIKIGKSKKNRFLTEYVGQEQGALWREEALKRIEKYRKNMTNIIVKNQNGDIIENANIDIKMNNNDFKFGTAIRMAEDTGINKFDNISNSLFNSISSENGFKWGVLSQNGSDIPNDVINFAKENSLYIRGHYLWCDVASGEVSDLVGNVNDDIQEPTMANIYNAFNSGNNNEEAENLITDLQNKFEKLVFEHIENMMTEFPEVQEWNVINEPLAQQYFKYYIYDKNVLNDMGFLNSAYKNISTYSDNENYYKFMANCFDIAKNINKYAKLVINDDKINGDISSSKVKDTIRIINNINKYTSNINALGIQYHVRNNYEHTPQSYYNQINYVLEQTGITDAVVTEYDNYISDKLNKYTDSEKNTKANYLRDTLIACYSNPNISGFNFWVYNSGRGSFVQEEWDVYEELMKEWLNDEQSGTTDENGLYSTRAYNGEYTAVIEVNGLKAEKTFTVSPDIGTVEIIINNTAEKLNIKQMPNKTQYIQGKEELDLTGGVLEVLYNDGTTKEIPLTGELRNYI